MKKGGMVAGFIAGGLVGMTAAVMAVPGYRGMVARKARCHGKKIMRAAKQFFP